MNATTLPPLAEPDDLVEFDGAPFPESAVDASTAQIRRLCGWHIAPTITETIDLDHDGSTVIHLPTLHVVDVTDVWDTTGTKPRALTGWRWSAFGMLEGRFPRGFRSVRIEFEHGYADTPPDLLPVIASRTQRRVMQENLGSRSVSYSIEADRAVEAALGTYMLGPRA